MLAQTWQHNDVKTTQTLTFSPDLSAQGAVTLPTEHVGAVAGHLARGRDEGVHEDADQHPGDGAERQGVGPPVLVAIQKPHRSAADRKMFGKNSLKKMLASTS